MRTDWLVSRIDQNDQIEHMVPGTQMSHRALLGMLIISFDLSELCRVRGH